MRIVSFGRLQRNSMVHAVLDCLGQKPELGRRFEYFIAGDGDPTYLLHLGNQVRHYGMEKRVHLLGRKSDKEMHELFSRVDFAVHLRTPHLGESSWSFVSAMLSGVPTLVWNGGFYQEIPDRCVVKIDTLLDLPKALETMANERRRCESIGRAARLYAQETFQTSQYVERFLSHAERVLGEQPFWSLASRVNECLSELNARPEDPWTLRVSRELHRLRSDAA